ncbi:MAG: TRAP transporter large permease subunit [Alphaproteobacteria bacterium]
MASTEKALRADALMDDASALDRLFAWVPTLSGFLAGVGVLAIFTMISFEVIARYFFNSPTSWVVEVSTYTMIGVAYLGAAYAHAAGANIRVELVLARLGPVARQRAEEVAAWCGLAFVLVGAWQVALFTHSNYINKTRSYIMGVPQWIPNLPIVVGLVILAWAVLAELRALRGTVGAVRDWIAPLAILAAVVGLFSLGSRFAPVGGIFMDWGTAIVLAAVFVAALAWSGLHVFLMTALVFCSLGLALYGARDLALPMVIGLIFILVIAIFLIGVRIAFGLGLIGLVPLYALLPFPLPATVAERAFSSIDSFSLTALPMFVLMGALLVRSGIAADMFEALNKWLGRFPGGIAHASIGACTMFAAVSGSSIATAATIGTVACPEMIRHGYAPRLAYGSVAAGGTLGILIPPSVPFIIYGTLVGASVSKLFIAGILPGLMLAAFMMAAIFLWAMVRPAAAPRAGRYSLGEKVKSLRGVLPFLVVMVLVLGSLYFGIVTPTEAGTVGAFFALVLCLGRYRLPAIVIWQCVLETVTVTAFILMIVFGASLMTYVFDYLKLAKELVSSVQTIEISRTTTFLLVALVYIVLGMFLDSISLITMTVPVAFPLMMALGFDPIWFGVCLVILVELGLITPPVGLNLFVLQGIGNVPLKEVVYGTLPFFVVMTISLALLYLFPGIAIWLPQHMN